MENTYRLPDYDRSLLSVTSSVFRFFGGRSDYPPLPEIEERLKEGGINKILLVLCDAMGENLLRRHLRPGSFLVKNDAAAISSVFPPTTTAATTAVWTGVSPIEHGWLGWSMYFKACAAHINTFIGTDNHTDIMVPGGTPAPKLMPLPPMPLGIEGLESHLIFPFETSLTTCFRHKHIIGDFHDMLACASILCAKEGRRLVEVYWTEPDDAMHRCGVDSPQAAEKFRSINRELELLAMDLPGDTLLIVTADHGQTDAREPFVVNECPEMDACLWMPPTLEGRAAVFYVKPRRRAQFEAAFQKYLSKDFILYTAEQAMENHLFGRGTPCPLAEDFLGDYIACATGSRYIRYDTINGTVKEMVGRHAGLTPDEMTVPVILYRGK